MYRQIGSGDTEFNVSKNAAYVQLCKTDVGCHERNLKKEMSRSSALVNKKICCFRTFSLTFTACVFDFEIEPSPRCVATRNGGTKIVGVYPAEATCSRPMQEGNLKSLTRQLTP